MEKHVQEKLNSQIYWDEEIEETEEIKVIRSKKGDIDDVITSKDIFDLEDDGRKKEIEKLLKRWERGGKEVIKAIDLLAEVNDREEKKNDSFINAEFFVNDSEKAVNIGINDISCCRYNFRITNWIT